MQSFEYPKIKLYFCEYDNKTIAFCKSNKTKEQKALLGRNYENLLSSISDVKFANTYIFQDDTVDVVKSKIHAALNTRKTLEIYFQKRIYNVLEEIELFLEDKFFGVNIIPRKDFKQIAEQTYTAIEIPSDSDDPITKMEAETILFKHLKKNPYRKVWLNNEIYNIDRYDIYKNTLYAIDSADSQQVEKNTIFKTNDEYEMMLKSYDQSSAIVKYVISGAQVRILPRPSDVQADVYSIFSIFEANSQVPFAKWLSPSNSLVKCSKQFVSTADGQSRVIVWSKAKKKNFIHSSEVLVLKIIPEEPIIGTVILYSNGVCDVKVNMRAASGSSSQLEKTLSRVYQIYQEKIGNSRDIDFKGVLSSPKSELVKVQHIQTHGVIAPKKMIKAQDLKDKISSMQYIYHSIDTNTNELVFLYKKSNAFKDEGNTHNLLNKISKSDSTDAQRQQTIKSIFISVDKDQIKSRYETWKAAFQRNFLKYVKTDAKTVLLILKKLPTGYQFRIDGTDSAMEVQHVIMYMLGAFQVKKVSSPSTETKSHTRVEIESDDESDNEDVFDFNDIMKKIEKQHNIKHDISQENEKEEGIPLNVQDMKRDMQCPTITGGAVKQGNSLGRMVLNELKKADEELFTTGYEQTYAKICQSSSMRQPLPLTDNEIAYNDKCFPGAINKHLKAGNNVEVNYTCPKIWCPISRVALTPEQFKKYGNKCPYDIDETPINFLQKSNDRVIGFLDKKAHSKKLAMPCCFIKDEDQKGSKDSSKYIQGSKPNQGRFAALPLNVHHLVENKNCGTDEGLRGHMTKDTKCYLRYGVAPSTQTLLQCLVELLEFKSEEYIISKIKKHINLGKFLTINNGQLLQQFMVNVTFPTIGEEKTPYYKKEFTEFKKFIGSQYESLRDVLPIDANALEIHVPKMTSFNSSTDNEVHQLFIKRYYVFFKVYKKFLDYIEGDSKKTHDIIMPLLENLGLIDLNVFLVSKTDIEALTRIDPDRLSALLYINDEMEYEPIFYVEYKPSSKKHGIIRRELHDKNVKLIQLLTSYFMEPKTDEQTILKLYGDQCKYLLDFTFKVIGIVTKDGVMLPFKEGINCRLDNACCFIDSLIIFGLNKLPSIADVEKHVCRIEKAIDRQYYTEYDINDAGSYLELLSKQYEFNFIPLEGFGTDQNSEVKEILINGQIFSNIQIKDERINYLTLQIKKQVLFESLLNEIITLYLHVPKIKEEIDFIRHHKNPLKISEKIKYLRDFFKSNRTFMKRMLVLDSKFDLINKSISNNNKPLVCSQQTMKKCLNNSMACAWDSDDNICKVKFVQVDLFEYTLDKALNYISNPINKMVLKLQQANMRSSSNMVAYDDTILFDQEALADIGKRLAEHNYNNILYDFEYKNFEQIPNVKTTKTKSKLPIKKPEEDVHLIDRIRQLFEIPSDIKKLYQIEEENIEKLFVDNVLIDNNKDARYCTNPSDNIIDKLECLSRIYNVNIVLTYRQSKKHPVPYYVFGKKDSKTNPRKTVFFFFKNKLYVLTKDDESCVLDRNDIHIRPDLFEKKYV